MKPLTRILLALLSLFVTDLQAQVATPHNFPHSTAHYTRDITGFPAGMYYSDVSMGMDGYVTASAGSFMNSIYQNYLLDAQLRPVMTFAPNSPLSGEKFLTTINKDRKIWFCQVQSTLTRVTVLTEQGVILSQFKLLGTEVKGMEADTSGHVFMVYESGGATGLMRFGSSYTPDFQKTFGTSLAVTKVAWGIDQRLYIQGNALVSLDVNGNVIKRITNCYTNFTVYPDHGLALVSFNQDTVHVARLDSNLNYLWRRKFLGGTRNYPVYPVTISNVMCTAMPGSEDLMVVYTKKDSIAPTCFNRERYESLVKIVLLDAAGIVTGFENMPHSTSLGWDELMQMEASPFGDPLVLTQGRHCAMTTGQTNAAMHVFGGYNMRANCGPYIGFATQPSTFGPVLALGAATTVPMSLALTADVNAFSFAPLSAPAQYTCHLPCLQATALVQSGGLVAFSDNVYGFHTIRYEFGDGTFGSTSDPLHQYPGPGNYTVLVIATNACGSDTVTFQVDACLAAQIVNPGSACLGVPRLLTEGSGLANDSLAWLVDGVPAGIGSSLSWTPTAVGTYQIGLIYRSLPCRDTVYASVPVYNAAPAAAFTYALTSFLTITCTNTSTNASSYLWDFGDGTTSTLANPSHTYAANGSYNICLTATNACGSATTCQVWNCPFPTANFTATINGNTVTLVDLSANALSMSWSFGDGTNATGPVTSHTFLTTGTFNICQTVTNNCASVTTCRSVTAIGNSNTYYSLNYASLGTVTDPKSVATNANGYNLIVGGSSAGAFLLMTDSTGGVRWIKTYPSANYTFNDVVAMPNGNFLVVGSTTVAGPSARNALWMQLSPTGTIVSSQVASGTQNAELVTVKLNRSGGYLVTGIGGSNRVYGKLDASLNLVWSRIINGTSCGLFESPDGTYWLVSVPNSSTTYLMFTHINSLTGVESDEYYQPVSNFSAIGNVTNNKYSAEMDCAGNIYVAVSHVDFISGVGNFQKISVHKFNTISHASLYRTYRLTGGSSGTAPNYDAYPYNLVIKADGNLLLMGYFHRIGDFSTNPRREKLLVDVNSTSMTIASAGFGTATTQDRYDAGALQPNGAYIGVGTVDGVLQAHRFVSFQCQASATTLVLNTFEEAAFNTNFYRALTNMISAAYASTSVSFTPAPTTPAGAPTVQCATPCNAIVNAAFTVSFAGNVATITSTSTPGANLSWTVPGLNCLTSNSFTTTIPCGTSLPVTLRATNGCTVRSVTQTVTPGGTIGSPALAPSLLTNVVTCNAGATTFTAAPGYNTYLWSNGATTSSTTITAPGSVNLLARLASSGCYFTDTATATVSNFAVALGADRTICADSMTTLSAPPGNTTYAWNTGETTASIFVGLAGSYSVTVTNPQGCIARDTVQVTVSATNCGPLDASLQLALESVALTAVVLHWTTSQIDGRFWIERSHIPGQFESLASMPGDLAHLSVDGFTWTDQAPLTGTTWYRVRQIHPDGSVSESRQLAAHLTTAPDGVRLYPVPTSDRAVLDLQLQAPSTVGATITSISGQVLATPLAPVLLDEGAHSVAFPTTELSEGMYLVQVSINGSVSVRKLVIAR